MGSPPVAFSVPCGWLQAAQQGSAPTQSPGRVVQRLLGSPDVTESHRPGSSSECNFRSGQGALAEEAGHPGQRSRFMCCSTQARGPTQRIFILRRSALHRQKSSQRDRHGPAAAHRTPCVSAPRLSDNEFRFWRLRESCGSRRVCHLQFHSAPQEAPQCSF